MLSVFIKFRIWAASIFKIAPIHALIWMKRRASCFYPLHRGICIHHIRSFKISQTWRSVLELLLSIQFLLQSLSYRFVIFYFFNCIWLNNHRLYRHRLWQARRCLLFRCRRYVDFYSLCKLDDISYLAHNFQLLRNILKFIKQHVDIRIHHLAYSYLIYKLVIVTVPLASLAVQAACRVVPIRHPSVVFYHTLQIVYHVLRASMRLSFPDNVVIEVQICYWDINQIVYFWFKKYILLFKPVQTQD